MTSSTRTPPVRVLAVADSDSYLKWSVATLRGWPSSWHKAQVVIDSPIRPSAAQLPTPVPTQEWTQEPIQLLNRTALLARIRREKPDVVLLACTGPVVAALTSSPPLRDHDRPVVVTGLPGISVPASGRALEQRRGADLLLLHSHREISDYTRLRAELDQQIELGLATLPFLTSKTDNAPSAPADGDPRGPVIFAAQATVPPARAQREQILLALAARDQAVIKVRGLNAEEQTHRERWPYPDLAAALVAAGRLPPGRLSVQAGSMASALRRAGALVTVSSTAALEAVAAGLPILILSDFGVNAGLINLVFDGSGCLGTLDDLRRGHFARPTPVWSRTNYFHPAADNDAEERLSALLDRRRAGQLPVRVATPSGWSDRRARMRLRFPRLGRAAARLRLSLQTRWQDRRAR